MFTGFSFGAKTTATPTFGTGSITFGTPATQPTQQFSFGNLTSSAPPNLFGTQTTTTAASNVPFKPSGFGVATTTPAATGFNLSTPGTGFAFAATSTPSFGNPTSSAPSTNLSFGAPTSSTGLTFGTPAPSTGLGSGLTFGTPVSSAAATNLGFKPTTSTGLTFGSPAATTGVSFGTASAGFGTSTAGTTGLAFGTPAATTTGLSFVSTTSVPPIALCLGTTPSAASLGFGTTTTTSTGLSFATTSSGFGLGSLASSAPPLGLTSTVTTQPSVGLGGIASIQAKTGTSATAQKELPPREQLLPNEFLQTVEHFKNVVQEEKNKATDVARCSIKAFHKVEAELDLLNHQFNQIENHLMNNRNLAEKLKYDTAKGVQNIEMAQRTQDTPPSLQYDNTAPLQFFLDLAENFEREMQLLKIKIDNTEKFVKKCNEPNVLTSQDLTLGLKRLHETFVALAGRMQAVHSQVETQKEVFLSLRKQAIKDNINPFEKANNKTIEAINYAMRNALKAALPNLASGPTPFNSMSLGTNNVALATQQTQPPNYPTTAAATPGFGFGSTASNFGMGSTNNSLFKPTGFNTQPFQLNTSSNFQLQKPPTGNKRGKQ